MEKLPPDAAHDFSRVLRVGVLRDGQLIDDELFGGRGEIFVGTGEDSDVHLDGEDAPQHFPLLACTRRGLTLRVDRSMRGAVQLEHLGESLSLDDLRAVAIERHGLREVELPPRAEGRIAFGQETILFQGVARRRVVDWLGAGIVLIAILGAVLGLVAIVASRFLPRVPAGDESIELPPIASSAPSPELPAPPPPLVPARPTGVAALPWWPELGWTPAFSPSTIADLERATATAPLAASASRSSSATVDTPLRATTVSAVFVGPRRRDAGPRHMAMEDYHPDGILTPSVIASELARRSGALQSAYERALRSHPRLHARAELRFVVARDGAVRDVELRGVHDPELARSITALASAWRFPSPSDGPVLVDYPITLRPMR